MVTKIIENKKDTIKYGIRSKNHKIGEYLIFLTTENIELNIGDEIKELYISMYSGGSDCEVYKNFSFLIKNSRVILVNERKEFTTYKITGDSIEYLSSWEFNNIISKNN